MTKQQVSRTFSRQLPAFFEPESISHTFVVYGYLLAAKIITGITANTAIIKKTSRLLSSQSIKYGLMCALAFSISPAISAHTPGLRVPDWYRAKLYTPLPPEYKEPFELCFEFQSLLAKLEKIDFQLSLPAGIELIEGNLSGSIKRLETNKNHKLNWLLKAQSEIKTVPLQLQLSFPYPKKELVAEIENIYHTEPTYMKAQLADFIQNMSETGQLNFNLSPYILVTEGFVNIPSLIFTNTMSIEGYSFPFLFYGYSEKPVRSETEILADIAEKDKFFQSVLSSPEALSFFRQQRPIDWQRTIEDSCYNYYLLSLKALHNKDYTDCAQWLEKLTEIMLKEEKINYELFLAARNTQALALLYHQDTDKAISLLTSTIRTATSSTVRHYLMYNLAVIYEKLANRPQMFHYLNEALRLNPAFTSAKKLQERYQQ